MEEELSYVGNTIRVFLSYSHKDKVTVGYIKACLETYGLEVFVAHDDISPSFEWQAVMEENLKGTDVFIPVLSRNFETSKWTDQESGMAFAMRKLIIPISLDGTHPYGFISRFQSLKFKNDDVVTSCIEIIKVLKSNDRFRKALADSLIKTIANVGTFDGAGAKFKLIYSLAPFTQEQINEIIKLASQNNQVYYSHSARAYLTQLIEEHKGQIIPSLLQELQERIDSE